MLSPRDEKLLDAFVQHAESELGHLSQEQSQEQLEKGWRAMQTPLASRGSHRSRRRRARTRPWLIGLAFAGMATAGVLFALGRLPGRGESALRFTVEGQVAPKDGVISTLATGSSRLLFSDNSRVQLGASTKVVVESVDAHGARIDLVDGDLDVYVKPRPHASWLFQAGPFSVRVKGTAFHLLFDPVQKVLRLNMASGLVEVMAPPSRSLAVAAGESIELFADPAATAFAARELAAAPALADPVGEAPGNSDEKPTPARPRPMHNTSDGRRHVATTATPASSGAATPASWARMLAQGDFRGVVADAERRGIEQTLAQASAPDLAALADSARYIKRHELARQVLLTMRGRFVGAEPSRDAAFFLGRLSESGSGNANGALIWYDTYLSESPRGLYASEALGREMTLLLPIAKARASKVAQLYLERFPHGSQAELARSILESTPE